MESGEIVHGESKLVALCTRLPFPTRATRTDSGIIDGDIEPVSFLRDGLRELSHLGQAGEISDDEFGIAAVLANFPDDLFASFLIAPMHEHSSACFTKFL